MPSQTARAALAHAGSAMKFGAAAAIGAGCIVALAGLAAVFANTDALVTRGFHAAIANAADAPPVAIAPGRPTVSGSEEFWLDRAVNDAVKPATWRQPAAAAAAVGQRFTLAANGTERTLEIVGIRSVPGAGETGSAAAPMLLVTAKDVADARAAPLRLVLEPGQSLPGLPQLHSL